MPKRTPRLARLRKTVNKWNMLYGLLVNALDTLRGRVLDLEQRQHDDGRDVEQRLDIEATELLSMGDCCWNTAAVLFAPDSKGGMSDSSR